MHKFCNLEFLPIVEHCQKRLQGWQALSPNLVTQRPYFINRSKIEWQILPEVQRKS